MHTRAPTADSFTSPRARLLGAAIDLFDRKGYAATAVREIAEAAGVAKPTLYYHFGNKEGIFVAILDRARDAFSATIDEAATGGSARVRLKALADRVFALMEDHVVVVRLMHATYFGPRDGAPPFDFEFFHHRLLAALSGLVAEGMRGGEFRQTDVEHVALTLLGAISMCFDLRLSHPELSLGRPGLARMLDVVFDGVACRPEEKVS